MDDVQRELLDTVLRRFHVALKTVRLYSSAHAVAQSVLPDLTGALQAYLARYGGLVAQVGKDRLLIEGEVFTENGVDVLAFFLHVRSVAALALHPGLTADDVGRLLGVLSLDRQALEDAGGVDRAAAGADLQHVQIKSVILAEGDSAVNKEEMVFALTRTGVLAPDQRDAVLQAVRGGPSAVADLLRSLQAQSRTDEDALDAVDAALDSLDRTILDEPVEDQHLLYQHLAHAQLLLDEPLRSRLALRLLPRAADGGAARTIASELTSEEIVQLVLGSSDRSAMAERIVHLLEGLTFEPVKASAVASALREALAADGIPVDPSPAGPSELRADLPEADGWQAVPPSLIELRDDDQRWLRSLGDALTERALVRDAARTLTNLLYAEEDPEQAANTARALGAHLPALAGEAEFETVAAALEALRHTAARGDAFAEPAHAEMVHALDGGVLERLLEHVFHERTPLPQGVRDSLRAARRIAIPRLMDLLEQEPQSTRRRRVCELLAEIATGEPGLLGARLASAPWHLARNLAFVLGELHDPDVVPHLVGLARHPEHRVRREVIDALRKLGTAEGREALGGFSADPDPRVQHHLIEGVEARYDGPAAAWLLGIVRSPDYTPRGVSLKIAAMKALARMRAPEGRPVLERLARRRWVFGRQRKAVRAAAFETIRGWPERGA